MGFERIAHMPVADVILFVTYTSAILLQIQVDWKERHHFKSRRIRHKTGEFVQVSLHLHGACIEPQNKYRHLAAKRHPDATVRSSSDTQQSMVCIARS